MKTTTLKKLTILLVFCAILTSFTAVSQVGGWKPDLVEDSNKALDEMIEKQPKLARRQGEWSVVNANGLVLKRGHDLKTVLRVLDKKPKLVSI